MSGQLGCTSRGPLVSRRKTMMSSQNGQDLHIHLPEYVVLETYEGRKSCHVRSGNTTVHITKKKRQSNDVS